MDYNIINSYLIAEIVLSIWLSFMSWDFISVIITGYAEIQNKTILDFQVLFPLAIYSQLGLSEYGSHIDKFLRNFHAVFYKVCTNLPFH